ncbi:MAG: peptidoglycan bridge formation glycyltransferase FemA/FemB family protein [Spirochaetaceae bacterium]|nr:peptidoglycan bridge formation glycyltransferase FemA/FemB family protein [Spirochaetaceae bacterium]
MCNQAESFLQSGFWGSFKARFGWNARSFLVHWGNWDPKPLLVIRRPLGLGVSFAYLPWGPEFPQAFPEEARKTALEELALALRPLLPKNIAFIRFDPPWYTEGHNVPPPVVGKPFTQSGADVQPPDTVLLDLTPSEDAILQGMKSKWRYNIGLAQKKGVIVRPGQETELNRFYTLLQETALRDGISIHSFEYYQTLFSHTREYPHPGQEAALYFAEHEGDLLAGIITLFRGKEAVYLYGASSDVKRNLMGPYALQWLAMRDAKAKGCEVYDLFGIPPKDDPDHPMAGLYRFKTGFGGRIIHRPGSWDYAYRPLSKGIFVAAEYVRKELRNLKKRKKRSKNPRPAAQEG